MSFSACPHSYWSEYLFFCLFLHRLVRIWVFLLFLTPLLVRIWVFLPVLTPSGQNISFSACSHTYWSESEFFCLSTHLLVRIWVFCLSSHLLVRIWVVLPVLTPSDQNIIFFLLVLTYWSESELFCLSSHHSILLCLFLSPWCYYGHQQFY